MQITLQHQADRGRGKAFKCLADSVGLIFPAQKRWLFLAACPIAVESLAPRFALGLSDWLSQPHLQHLCGEIALAAFFTLHLKRKSPVISAANQASLQIRHQSG